MYAPPTVRVISRNLKGLDQGWQLQEHFVLATPEDIRQDLPRAVIDGMPRPSLLVLLADLRLHVVYFCFFGKLNDHFHLIRVQQRKQTLVDTAQR